MQASQIYILPGPQLFINGSQLDVGDVVADGDLYDSGPTGWRPVQVLGLTIGLPLLSATPMVVRPIS